MEPMKVTLKERLLDAFGHNIRRVLRPGDLDQLNISSTGSFLHPKVGDRQVADPTKSSAAANTNCRRRVGEDGEAALDTQVLKKRLQSQCDRRALADASELGFRRAHSHNRLSVGPGADKMGPKSGYTARRRTSGPDAASKVGVDVDIKIGDMIFEVKAPHQSGLMHQVPDDPL